MRGRASGELAVEPRPWRLGIAILVTVHLGSLGPLGSLGLPVGLFGLSAFSAFSAFFASEAFAQSPPANAPKKSTEAHPPAGPRPLSESLTGDAKADYDAAKLLVGDGDWAGAEIKLQAAYDKSAEPRLLWNIAACEKNQRHYARTVALVRKYLAEGGDLLGPADRAEATALLQAIESFTVKLTVTVNEPGAEVTIDDQRIGSSPVDNPVVVDIGARKIEVRKVGFKDWLQSVPIGGSAEAKVDVSLVPEVHEGHLVVTTQPDASITIDGQPAGAGGRFEGQIKSGGHQLRVEAPGMVPYQSEVVLSDEEHRSVDVLLQKVYVPPPPEDRWPGFEMGISEGPGVKLHGDRPWMNMTRLDIGWHPGRRTDLGFFIEADELDASRNCGTDEQSAATASALTLDPIWSFSSCVNLKAGLQVLVHLLPRSPIDPWLAFEPAFRVSVFNYTVFQPLSGESNTGGDATPAVDFGGRLGLDWHPLDSFHAWAIGGYGSLVFSVAKEQPKFPGGQVTTGSSPSQSSGNQSGGPDAYFSVFFGLRTSLAL